MNKVLSELESQSKPTQQCIYMDYLASTPVDPRVVEVMKDCMLNMYSNPHSNHSYGDQAQAVVNKARLHITELINCSKGEIVFTSGATESINLGIRGFISSLRPSSKPHRIALLPVEHSAVIETCKALEREKLVELEYLKIDNKGRVELNSIEEFCRKGLSLLCVMAAQNEIGNIYPVKEIGEIAQTHNVPFFCDGAQAVGKVPIDFKQMGMTFLTVSGHKMYGPKGIGALIIKSGTKIKPLFYGGEQQKGIRPGTLNTTGIAGLGEACRLRLAEMIDDESDIKLKRNILERSLLKYYQDALVNGNTASRLSGVLNISFPHISNDVIISRIRRKLAISTGTACSSGVEHNSQVMDKLALPENFKQGTLRISIGKFTSDREIEDASNILIDEIIEFRKEVAIQFMRI